MYNMQANAVEQEEAQAALNQQLEHDSTGELRDRWVDELMDAARAIEAALAGRPPAGDTEVLRDLLDAVRLGERVLLDVWNSLHG